ncbi:MAG: hypothetical protein CMF80_04740 [Candidatus Marinimicrobia bacterium]|nr:hypothetical protein [Candidatus Neomarinimicrobiota bacterium]
MKMRKYILVVILLCMIFTNQIEEKNIHNQILGRDKDPKIESDISKLQLLYRKSSWTILTLPGLRFLTEIIYPKSTISHFNIKEKVVAFTIDDGFYGMDNPNGSMIDEVTDLFSKYDAKATFFTSGSHCYLETQDLDLFFKNGHEIANHSMYDWPYDRYSKKQFLEDFNMTDSILSQYTNDIPKWYRAPHAKLSKVMDIVLKEKGYKHVVCDVFANDTAIPDSKWIAKYILKRVKPGSILLIHMPEKGVREWNFEAMKLTLIGLKKMGYNVVNLSELQQISEINND